MFLACFRILRFIRHVERTPLPAAGKLASAGCQDGDQEKQSDYQPVFHVRIPEIVSVYGVHTLNPKADLMNPDLLDAVALNPAGPPAACIIWLHGLGADGHDFEPLIPQLGIVEALDVRVVLPHAPRRPVTINGGLVMRAWYDIAAPDLRWYEDDAGIRDSARRLSALIERETAGGIPVERILLAGFSQGGAIALHTGLRHPQPLAGILALSTYLPLADTLSAEAAAANRTIPILMAHGDRDPVVPPSLAQQSRRRLEQQGYNVAWHSYPMPHALCPNEVADIREWLVQTLGGK